EKERYKKMDISSEYIIDMIRKCEYLSERGEDVVRHIYDLLSSNLSLWHKYHIAKAISSPALAQLQASDAHYSQLLDAMKYSIDIAIASAQMGSRSASSAQEGLMGDAGEGDGFLGEAYYDEDDEEEDFMDEGREELIDEYVNDLILSESPPDYIASLNDMNRGLLTQIVKDLFAVGAKRDAVDSFLNMVANAIFMNLSDRSKQRLLGMVKRVLGEHTGQRSYEQALYHIVYFICHPQLARLSQRDVDWLVESVERLKVDFYDNSEASALIEFLECFHKVVEGTELTTMCFYLGRLTLSASASPTWCDDKVAAE
ncbi:MAG: hypothetical protein P8104_07275, partial [Gammaproteobacteria bacterium]